MNTGFLGPAVTTVLTVYGIETWSRSTCCLRNALLQQYLPFTVLKHETYDINYFINLTVTTVLTVYGIETCSCPTIPITTCYNSTYRLRYWNVAPNALESLPNAIACYNSTYRLRYWNLNKQTLHLNNTLQQYLPFTVLKHNINPTIAWCFMLCYNSTYRLRYWNPILDSLLF